MMQRSLFILIGCFLLTLAAGGVLGRLAPGQRQARPSGDGGWLVQQLQLTSTQHDQIQGIWDDTHAKLNARVDQRRELDKQWQDDVYNLLTDDQKQKYENLREQYAAKIRATDSETDALIKASVEKTKLILTPAQRDKYDSLLAQFPPRQTKAAD